MFKAVFMPALEISNKKFEIEFNSKKEAEQNLDSIANALLFMQDNSMMNDFSNCAWIEEFIDGSWEEAEESE